MNKSSLQPWTATLAVVVCTKDRPNQLMKVLRCIGSQTFRATAVVVVDSSTDTRSETVFNKFSRGRAGSFFYLKSSPGLPRQRNEAIDHLLRMGPSSRPSHTWFLDDDIEFGKDFFELGMKVFLVEPGLVLLGAYDHRVPSKVSEIVTSIASLQLAKGGKVLKSGLVMPPRPSKAFEESEFVPGFSMLLSTETLARVRFDSSIRMYGEDLEFQLRLASYGRIGCSGQLGLDHKSSSINRESARSISRYTDGFRWRIHKQFPTRAWGPMVIFSSLVLFVGNLIDAAIKWNPERLATALGHWDFLRSLSQRLPVEQQVRP